MEDCVENLLPQMTDCGKELEIGLLKLLEIAEGCLGSIFTIGCFHHLKTSIQNLCPDDDASGE